MSHGSYRGPIACWLLLGCLALAGCQRADIIEHTAAAATTVAPSEADLKAKLSPEQYRVCRGKGTERPFQNAYWNHHGDGVYHCVACGEELFDSQTKFDSGTGWPSFWAPVQREAVAELDDKSIPAHPRTELTCRKCGSHLGHVFDDGPSDQTGMRYCVNSASLSFQERQKRASAAK
jgi:peptide-methionine (R)-S-oxide reductase